MRKYIKIKEESKNINQRTVDLFIKPKKQSKLTKEEMENMANVQEMAKRAPENLQEITTKLFKTKILNEYEYFIFCAKHGLLGFKVTPFSEIASKLPIFDIEKVLAVYNSALKIIAGEIAVLNDEESLSV